ncbi:HofP DNA utilization family protein [Erwinia amylovora]|uniref:DUF2531 family protein n=4 Tax=Erwinia amylovora TaxID=552 RepID=A0A831ELJ6_ERWAM|nr:HofP DNA utilization family protein [Erwinia amylovora]CBX82333.1 hypothetical protein predicted by Glimmer/Critica [Erwinia amylovora ATCC BAA-2158]CCP04717.1 hypothetical protein BN439_3694 [Erwinia amylovora Ea644]CCP08783.1 hypothetical protein BN440_3796 [Erwinia amylovora MR1]CDK16751.1 hypothetical protein LA635_3127 [Erwinia amylovora LA635]CDK20119.1 hypothetical protein LA636_3127 [Erwinia amylovora LA636]CDK23490.1 hypothetical protein LA637_3130 [Erwinia amylovora LA637]
MKAKLACALLSLLIFHSRARDPFFPPQSRLCQPLTSADGGWRLLGVIGRSGYYDAWLTATGGKTLRRKTGDLLPGTPWRITRIDAYSTTLTPIQDCQPAHRLVLKGRHNAQDPLSVDGVN